MSALSLPTAGDISLVNDFSKLQSYLYRLQEELRYMFNNLDPDENFNEQARLIYTANGEKQASLEVALDHISLEMVNKDNIIAAINLSEEGIGIQADKIRMEGLVTVNSRFKIGLDGSIEATDGRFSGDISASDITGSTITGNTISGGTINGTDISGTNITGSTITGNTISGGTVSGTEISGGSADIGQLYSDDSYTKIGGFYVTNEEYGRDILQTLDERCGISALTMSSGGLWLWCGWEDETNFDFAVNNGGLCVARDFQILGYQEYGSIRQTLDRIIEDLEDHEERISALEDA